MVGAVVNMDANTPLQLMLGDHMGDLHCLMKSSAAAWSEAAVVHRHGELDKGRAVNALSASRPSADGQDAQIVIASRENGDVTLHSAADCSCTATLRSAAGVPAIGAEWLDPEACTRLLAVHQDGSCRAHTREADSRAWSQLRTWQTAANLQCFGLDMDGRRAAVGGQGSELSVWDVEQGV
jgi:hypothetical protein